MIDPIARRIAIFLEDNTISIKDFAEKLNVQRSSLSHILSGRNKPSLDFILKMLRAYPSLSERWLLHGKGFPVSTDTAESPKAHSAPVPEEKPDVTDVTPKHSRSDVTNVIEGGAVLPEDKTPVNQNVGTEARLVKVLLLYSDGSFRQYHSLPADQEE